MNDNEFKSRVCCLNIVGFNNELLNSTGCPMIMYWDGESNVEQDLKANKGFLNILYKNAFNLKHYGYGAIAWAEYSFNEDNPDDPSSEHIMLNARYIESMFPLADNDDIAIMILYEIIYNMYMKAFNTDTLDVPEDMKKEDVITKMLSTMFSHYGDKLSRKSVINHIRNKGQENGINQTDIIKLIQICESLIKE